MKEKEKLTHMKEKILDYCGDNMVEIYCNEYGKVTLRSLKTNEEVVFDYTMLI